MKISVKLGVSQNLDYRTFDLDDLGVTEQDWNEMTELEKEEFLQKEVFGLPDQPYWMVESFDEF